MKIEMLRNKVVDGWPGMQGQILTVGREISEAAARLAIRRGWAEEMGEKKPAPPRKAAGSKTSGRGTKSSSSPVGPA